MTYALVVILCAAVNRMAGGGWPVGSLMGTPYRFLCGRFQTAAYIGLVALLLHDWAVALAFGLGFLFWRLFGWGHLISLGRPSGATARPANGLDKILVIRFGPHVGLAIRMGAFVFPALYVVGMLTANPLLGFLAVPFGLFAMLAYEFSWTVWGDAKDPIREAELTVGALWGLLVVAAALA
jgi:hypothetical protein